MRETLFLLALFFTSLPLYSMQYLQGNCEQGGHVIATAGMNSTTKAQVSYPQCTVNVYGHNTVVLSTIYADNLSTPLANPFTADANGHWGFYVADGHYDVTLSGTGITTPFTIWDLLAWTGPYFNAKDFGATCNGSVDDTVYLQRAFTAAAPTTSSPTTTVLIPAGKCRITSTLTLPRGVNIIGTSWVWGQLNQYGSSIISTTTISGPAISQDMTSVGTPGGAYSSIKNLAIVVTATGGTIYVKNTLYFNVQNCWLANAGYPIITNDGNTIGNSFINNYFGTNNGQPTYSIGFIGSIHNNVYMSMNYEHGVNGLYIAALEGTYTSIVDTWESTTQAGVVVSGQSGTPGYNVLRIHDGYCESTGTGGTHAYCLEIEPTSHTYGPSVYIDGLNCTGNSVIASCIWYNPTAKMLTAQGVWALGTTGADIVLGDISTGTSKYAIFGNELLDTTAISGTNPSISSGMFFRDPGVQQLSTGAKHSVDDVITALQFLGLVKQ